MHYQKVAHGKICVAFLFVVLMEKWITLKIFLFFLIEKLCSDMIYNAAKHCGSIAKLVRQLTATQSSAVQVRLEPPIIVFG